MNTKFYELSQVMDYHRFNPVCVIRVGGLKMLWVITVKPEITHTLGGHQILWVITGYELLQVCVIRVGGLKML